MSKIVGTNRDGKCPYCLEEDFDEEKTELRNPPSHFLKKCNGCGRWSARSKKNLTHYPLQDPNDKESSPATTSRV